MLMFGELFIPPTESSLLSLHLMDIRLEIDCFFMPRMSLHSVLSASIGSIVISDHAEVILDIKLRGHSIGQDIGG